MHHNFPVDEWCQCWLNIPIDEWCMKIIPRANRKNFPDNHQTTGSAGHGSFPFGLSDGPNNSRINQVATVIIIHLHISSYIMIYCVYIYILSQRAINQTQAGAQPLLPCALKARAQQPSSASRESHACLHHQNGNSIAGSHLPGDPGDPHTDGSWKVEVPSRLKDSMNCSTWPQGQAARRPNWLWSIYDAISELSEQLTL